MKKRKEILFTLVFLTLFFNPILTKFFTGGGVGGQFDPPSDLGPKGADRREILHGCQDTCKEYCYKNSFAKNDLFIILL